MHHHAHITLAGLITDLNLEYGRKNTAILDVRLTGQVHNQGSNGQVHIRTFHHHIRALGAYGEGLYAALEKGKPALAHGRLEQFRYTSREDGNQRSLVRIIAEGVSLLEGDPEIHTDENDRAVLKNGMNSLELVGALVSKPELKRSREGAPYAQFSVAVDEYGNTHYFNVTAWRDLAERLATADKGDAIHLSGQLTNHSWVAADGTTKYAIGIEAREGYALKFARPKPNPRARAA